MLKNKRIFISGGAGVIGNELVNRLRKIGAIIFVGDLKLKPKHWPNTILYRQGDLNCVSKNEIDSFKPDIFFHLAASFERSIESYDFWDENYHNNVKLTNHLLSIFKDLPYLKKIIFASSYLLYDKSLYSSTKPKKNLLLCLNQT